MSGSIAPLMPGERGEVPEGPAAGGEQDLAGELLLGRTAEGFGSLSGDPEISRRHAQISRTPEGRLYISDLGSTNGTFVNGERISGSAWLNPGDVVKVGQSTLKVTGGAGAPGATSTPPPPAAAPTRAPTSAPEPEPEPEPEPPAPKVHEPEPAAPAPSAPPE